MRLTIDGRIIPLAARCEVGSAPVRSILRLKDGVSEIGYAIAEAADIVTLPAEIVAAATEYGANLIAIGTRGRTGLARLFLGSVARSVLGRATSSSVLIVKE
mgnify:CR=1 FL=1